MSAGVLHFALDHRRPSGFYELFRSEPCEFTTPISRAAYDASMYPDVITPNWPVATTVVQPGIFHWQARVRDLLCARFVFVPRERVEVDLWWNRAGGKPDVQLVWGLQADVVELGSLTGNGFDHPSFHQAGFGTFAVNLAIEALRDICPPDTRVVGVLSNTDEAGLETSTRERLEESRRVFWRRFGLHVVRCGEPTFDYLTGTVADLRQVATGKVAGQFPRLICLEQFQLKPQIETAMIAPALQGG
jgi:hypothetical protein